MPPRYVVGVTGGIATGKSAVMAILGGLGADCIDADLVYHDLIQPGLLLWERLRSRFGNDIVADSGQIDRRALGAIVFSDPEKLAELDEITHRVVIEEVVRRTDASRKPVVAIEAVKLIESGLSARCDETWLVVANPGVQRARLVERSGLSTEEADRRIASQPNESSRRRLADQVIDNSGSLDSLGTVIEALWRALPTEGDALATTPLLPK